MNYVTNLPPCVNHFIVLNLNIRPMLFSRCHYTVFFASNLLMQHTCFYRLLHALTPPGYTRCNEKTKRERKPMRFIYRRRTKLFQVLEKGRDST